MVTAGSYIARQSRALKVWTGILGVRATVTAILVNIFKYHMVFKNPAWHLKDKQDAFY